MIFDINYITFETDDSRIQLHFESKRIQVLVIISNWHFFLYKNKMTCFRMTMSLIYFIVCVAKDFTHLRIFLKKGAIYCYLKEFILPNYVHSNAYELVKNPLKNTSTRMLKRRVHYINRSSFNIYTYKNSLMYVII